MAETPRGGIADGPKTASLGRPGPPQGSDMLQDPPRAISAPSETPASGVTATACRRAPHRRGGAAAIDACWKQVPCLRRRPPPDGALVHSNLPPCFATCSKEPPPVIRCPAVTAVAAAVPRRGPGGPRSRPLPAALGGQSRQVPAGASTFRGLGPFRPRARQWAGRPQPRLGGFPQT